MSTGKGVLVRRSKDGRRERENCGVLQIGYSQRFHRDRLGDHTGDVVDSAQVCLRPTHSGFGNILSLHPHCRYRNVR